MKTRNRVNFLYKKYKRIHPQNFYIFAWSNKSNSELDLNFKSLLHKNKINLIKLPSTFELIKEHKVQGPGIFIIYSKEFNFNTIQCLLKLQSTLFKIYTKWYLYKILSEIELYKTPSILCQTFNFGITKKILQFYEIYPKLKEN